MRAAQLKVYVPATIAVVGLSIAAAKLFHWPVEKAMFLAPIIVVCVGLLGFLAVLWARIAWTEWKGVRRKRFWLAVAVAFVLVLTLLTVLGVELPRYE